MYPIDLSDKTGIIFGVANQRSIAWSIAEILHEAGAKLALAYQNERVRGNVEALTGSWDDALLIECDASEDSNVAAAFDRVGEQFGGLNIIVHSIAFANREDLGGRFVDTGRDGFRVALDISAYTLLPLARYGAPLMAVAGGSIVTLTFQASTRAFPGYNVMGTAKAALENEVRQLAADLGEEKVRVNAISAGPLDTLSSRAIGRYRDMKRIAAERSPMKRNITHEEVAKTALFLCSDLSSGITGEIIHVDAGYNIMGI